jgi:hypothetical protein
MGLFAHFLVLFSRFGFGTPPLAVGRGTLIGLKDQYTSSYDLELSGCAPETGAEKQPDLRLFYPGNGFVCSFFSAFFSFPPDKSSHKYDYHGVAWKWVHFAFFKVVTIAPV